MQCTENILTVEWMSQSFMQLYHICIIFVSSLYHICIIFVSYFIIFYAVSPHAVISKISIFTQPVPTSLLISKSSITIIIVIMIIYKKKFNFYSTSRLHVAKHKKTEPDRGGRDRGQMRNTQFTKYKILYFGKKVAGEGKWEELDLTVS